MLAVFFYETDTENREASDDGLFDLEASVGARAGGISRAQVGNGSE